MLAARSSNYAFESCWLVEREPPELRGPISDEGGYARHPEKESRRLTSPVCKRDPLGRGLITPPGRILLWVSADCARLGPHPNRPVSLARYEKTNLE